MRKTLSAGLFLVLLLATSAQAVVVQVDWSATIPGTNSPAPGPGLLSGSLGVFDVNAAGDQFTLPADGSLTVLASGFSDGFPNGIYPLTRVPSQGAPILEFLSIGSTAADFAVNFVDNNAGILSPFTLSPLTATLESYNLERNQISLILGLIQLDMPYDGPAELALRSGLRLMCSRSARPVPGSATVAVLPCGVVISTVSASRPPQLSSNSASRRPFRA